MKLADWLIVAEVVLVLAAAITAIVRRHKEDDCGDCSCCKYCFRDCSKDKKKKKKK